MACGRNELHLKNISEFSQDWLLPLVELLRRLLGFTRGSCRLLLVKDAINEQPEFKLKSEVAAKGGIRHTLAFAVLVLATALVVYMLLPH